MNEVYITATGSYLPHEPVGNDEIESVLGMIGGKPSRARRIILRNNGIQSRHYAIDKASGQPTMSNAQLTARAIQALGVSGNVDVLATGTSTPDQLAPNHGVMVHGELGWDTLEVVSTAGICLAGATALKHAFLSVKSGEAQRAVATGSERISPHLLARQFEAESEHKVQELEDRPEIAFEKDFLRWMLSDGAGAVLLENQARGPLSLKIHWIELFSYAHLLPACMYMGAEKKDDGSLKGWADFSLDQCVAQSTLAVKQDARLLNENIIPITVGGPLKAIQAKRKLTSDQVDWFLPHISSMYFAEPFAQQLADIGFPIERSKWFTNLTTRGNTGSASPYIMLDELFHSGRIQKGHKLLMFIPESGRFSSGFVYLEAV
ncbi:3-oxoacyl-[acyl-carrier-protein] synthase-3 [Paucimonas lemoignei]|uniref:3-oxoacyl-[acyl-carrier-protein] synthase-3 n=1 Tax=Paucimonas lemoignei TaxID=29443 RepID=A0A4R3HV12_PAULE|nr:beta-ketoacyl-ACP synthase III [Paucimonas lemoignei]TCS36343.1 3-oxoacyl-[acyl-carrier-protein] synthase-3 [Paucimonas lemoignei]